MKFNVWMVLALASVVHCAAIRAASFPGRVVSHVPGGLPASLAAYTNAAILLAEPARSTPGQWGGPVDPFSPPYLSTQLLSLGTNGSVTVAFDQPVLNRSTNPFGVDFILYGNSGFMITNGDYSGGGVTDGTVFGKNGSIQVSVSRDNVQYYVLKQSPDSDGLFPTDGSGLFGVAVDPALSASDFAAQGLSGIRQLYAGASGGTGYDVDWARDSQGSNPALADIRYVRMETIDGHYELGGIAAVAVDRAGKFELNETFTANPANSGWHIAGDASLFRWDSDGGFLEATWDSSKSNSFFYHTLPREITPADTFALECDLIIKDIAAGVNAEKPFAFELAIGFFNSAMSLQYSRGTGSSSPNLVEFDYFPDTGFGATLSPVIVSSNNQFIPSFSYPLELAPGKNYRLTMDYAPAIRTLHTAVTLDGVSIGAVKDVVLPASFTGFAVDAFSISSYSDAGAGGSILAHGVVDNIKITVEPRAALTISGSWVAGQYVVRFSGSSRMAYALERSVDLKEWTQVADWSPGIDGEMETRDPSAPSERAYYRIKAR